MARKFGAHNILGTIASMNEFIDATNLLVQKQKIFQIICDSKDQMEMVNLNLP